LTLQLLTGKSNVNNSLSLKSEIRIMKVLLDIKDSKANFVLELLENFKFVKAETLTPHKTEVLKGLKSGLDEMREIEAGRLKGISAEDLINKL